MQEGIKDFELKDIFGKIKPAMNLTKLLSLGFGLILITWLLSQLEWEATLEILREVPPSLLFLGFLCYGVSFYLRALRFRVLLPQDKPVKSLFPIVLVHYTALNIIPARLGELSYVYLLKKVNDVSVSYSLSNLIIARIFDQIAIALLFLLSALFVDLPPNWLKLLSLGVGAFLIVTFALLMVIMAYKETCLLWLRKILEILKWDTHPFMQRCMHEIEEVIHALHTIRVKKNAFKILGVSILIWLGIFSVNYFVLHAFHVTLSYVEVIMTSTFIILLSLLPVQILSGFGIRETTWVFIALALGIPKNIAITSAFGSHILSVIYLVIFGIYGMLRLQNFLNSSATK